SVGFTPTSSSVCFCSREMVVLLDVSPVLHWRLKHSKLIQNNYEHQPPAGVLRRFIKCFRLIMFLHHIKHKARRNRKRNIIRQHGQKTEHLEVKVQVSRHHPTQLLTGA
ncbi:hypothetical protein ATANTOWER_010529, partial [Ataeniobius toweri]|nr:hypothetical protein [Ataeniobius toweri]